MLFSCVIPTLNEEEHMGFLIDSIFRQDHRPVEVLIVDGGSKDQTIEIVRTKQKELNSEGFSIKILFEKDFGGISSPANARNIGAEQSTGDYLMFLDADIFLIESDSLSKIKAKLDEVKYCCVRTKPIIDSELEHQIALGDVWHIHPGAFRKEFFKKYKFNPELGLGEDEDFWYRSEVDLNIICETTVGRHFPHTIEEYKKQQLWYGRSYLKYMRIIIEEQRHLFWKFFRIFAKNAFYLFSPLLLAVAIFISQGIFLSILSVLTATFILGLYRSPEKNTERLLFLIWRSYFEAWYFMQGLASGLIKN